MAANSGFVVELHTTGGSGSNLAIDPSCGDLTGVDYFSQDSHTWYDMGTNISGDNILFLKALVSNIVSGDANQDGKVDINDLTIVLSNYNRTGMAWTTGDFNSDGKVDINDLTIILANYNKTAGASDRLRLFPSPPPPRLWFPVPCACSPLPGDGGASKQVPY